jgi:3-methyladenine DNA glycosylase AlkD
VKRSATASLVVLRRELRALADPRAAKFLQRFFKTGPGGYGAGDRFLGLRVPELRRLAREHRGLGRVQTLALLRSRWHEERLLALFLLVARFRRGTADERAAIARAYLAHTRCVNNWDLVDASAGQILGAHLYPGQAAVLERLARSRSLWERRIAIMATSRWIREREFGPTLRVARMLLDDPHNLIHKAVGWMLREVGKRDRWREEAFLRRHGRAMPRTMLRYAIERLPGRRRREYLRRSRNRAPATAASPAKRTAASRPPRTSRAH